MLFFPWLKAQYGPGERIFFSAANWSLPMSPIGAREDWSLFCYDSLTGTVTDVLPLNIKFDFGGSIYVIQFSLSPDGKKVLLPTTKSNFIIYELGKDSKNIQVKEQESGGDSPPELFPAWKGNNEISCLAYKESKFLTEEAREKFKHDDEVVILDSNGEFKHVLSNSWSIFNEATPAAENQTSN